MGDYLNLPEIGELDLSGYRGRAGDATKVLALDDVEVVTVDIVIRNAAGTVLEQGPAAIGTDGKWAYVATVAVPAGNEVTVEATAKDRPGHTGAGTATQTIA